MKIIIATPTKAYVEGNPNEIDSLRDQLTYTNTAVQHEIKRHYNNHWYRSSNPERWGGQLKEMQKALKPCLVFQGDQGTYIRPGSIPYLDRLELEVVNEIKYPTPKKVPWAKPLPFNLYPYQDRAVEKLMAEKHGCVSMTTGSGKSACLLKICRETGFRTAIIAPSKSIYLELVEKFEHHLGKGAVGSFGNGKKKFRDKKFIICIGDSLCNIQPGSEEWEFFSGLDMVLVDESHTWGANTLETVCHGVLADVPFRMFFSGTQTRGDGAVKLLESIIGKTVHTLTTKEAVDGGYICPHRFRIVETESSNPNFGSSDILEQKRNHLLRNRNIGQFVARLANADAIQNKRQTLVLVEELGQIAMLLPMIKTTVAIAHSEKNAVRLEELGLWKVEPKESVDLFNQGKCMILIGSSAVATGTNIYPTHNTVNWVGGSSEIRCKQGAVGRSSRLHAANPHQNPNATKTEAIIYDFDVNVPCLDAHLEDRISYYAESGSEIKRVKMPK